MALRRTVPLRHTPAGTSDTLDSTDVFPGAMASLANLIPDPTTAGIWQCRPASSQLTDFTGFNTPGTVSAMLTVGNRAYGMIGSQAFPGYDEPFCYDIVAGAFVAITGPGGANLPATQSTTGDWVPPIMALVGTKIIVTHPGFNIAGGTYFGVIETSVPSALTWTATNTSPTALPSLPVSVAQFNGRAWFLCNPPTGNPATYFSDILAATTITNGTQILTYGDNVPLTHAAPLQLSSPFTGGIIQSLIVFKGVSQIAQVTGDAANTPANLAMNILPVATGTLAPLSVSPTSKGLAFMAPDGYRILDPNSAVSDPIGGDGSGVAVPFRYCSVPTRACSAFNNGVLRASVQNGYASGAPQEEYWFHVAQNKWSGPHTFPASQIQPYKGTFIMAAFGVPAKLFQSDVAQTATSGFTENGIALNYSYKTARLPDSQQMSEMEITETTINIGFVAGLPDITVTAIDEDDNTIDTVTITVAGSATMWGGFTWGAATWGAAASPFKPRRVSWTIPIVFRRLYLNFTGLSAASVRYGDLFMRYRILRYLQGP